MLALNQLGDGLAGDGHRLVKVNPSGTGNADIHRCNAGVKVHLRLGGWGGLGGATSEQQGKGHKRCHQKAPGTANGEGQGRLSRTLPCCCIGGVLQRGSVAIQATPSSGAPAPSSRISWCISVISRTPSRHEKIERARYRS